MAGLTPASAPGLLYALTDPSKWIGCWPRTAPTDPALLYALHGDAQTYSDEPFVIRRSSHLGELEDGRQFCIGCGRLLDAWTEDGKRWWRPASEDGQETKRVFAGQRAKVEGALCPTSRRSAPAVEVPA